MGHVTQRQPVVQRLLPQRRGILRRPVLGVVPPGYHPAMWCRVLADGAVHIEAWREGEALDESRDFLIGVSSLPVTLPLVFGGLRTGDGYGLIIRFVATARLARPELFIKTYGARRIADEGTVAERDLVNRVTELTSAHVRQRAVEWTFHDLRKQHGITPLGWAALLNEVLVEPRDGTRALLTIEHVDDVSYDSKDGEAAIDRAQREADERRLLAERQLEFQREAERTAFEAKWRAHNAAIQAAGRAELEDAKLDAFEREARRNARLAELEIQRAEMEAEAEEQRMRHLTSLEALRAEHAKQTAARIAAETDRLRAEALHERLRAGAAQQEAEATARASQIKAAHAQLDELNKTVAELMRLRGIEAAMRDGHLPDPHGAALRHVALGAAALHRIAGKPHQLLSALVHQRQAAGPSGLAMERRWLTSRDLGIVRVDTIEIGTPFEAIIRAASAGWLTMINFGTSGLATLLCPNKLAGLVPSRLAPGEVEVMPGPRLLPGAYIEEKGPPGSQEVVAILTGTPLFEEAELTALAAGGYILPEPRLSVLLERLDGLPPETWHGAALGVNVLAPAGRR